MPLDNEPFRGPVPKAGPRPRKEIRKVDKKATKRAVSKRRDCGICGLAAATGHHVIARGSPHFGDDVDENIVPLCGSGTTGCHGLVENNDVTARRGLGDHLVHERPDVIAYVHDKLGAEPGADWLRRRLFIL